MYIKDCNMYQIPRSGRKRGEVAVLYNTALNEKLITVDRSITTFEFIHCDVSAQHHRFQLYVIYRPPPSKSNNIKTSIFFAEWSEFLDRITVSNDDIVITGDLNFHLDNPSNCDARTFLETMTEHELVQHIRSATYVCAHILDVVISRGDSLILLETPLVGSKMPLLLPNPVSIRFGT